MIIVDDSAFMRSALSMMIKDEEDIDIVATGKNGLEAVELVKKLNPDIVTLDIEMPKMDGLTALDIIMKENPTPVLMISSLTTEGAEATLKAFDLGAVDFISKEMSFINVDIGKIKEDLLKKIRQFAKSKKQLTHKMVSTRSLRLEFLNRKIGNREPKEEPRRTIPDPKFTTDPKSKSSSNIADLDKIINKKVEVHPIHRKYKILCIGTSTGGPIALQSVLPMLPSNFPMGVVIVQHMPPNFTKSLATRLNASCKLEVREAEEGDVVEPGKIFIAPGGKHLTIIKDNIDFIVHLSDNPYGLFHKPSVDVMFSSVASFCKQNVISVILTGMGKDGLEGMRRLKDKGAYTIAESEETCVVYGMPKAVVEANLADRVVPLNRVHEEIINIL